MYLLDYLSGLFYFIKSLLHQQNLLWKTLFFAALQIFLMLMLENILYWNTKFDYFIESLLP